MRKGLIAAGVVVAIVVIVALLSGGNGNGGYVVRAIFDNGGFMVKGEEVRVGGATVGTIESVGVTQPGEVTSYEKGEPVAVPGKAVIVMKIEDEGFQDFRADAGCYIRPQSLIGEKFIDCRPTLPRAPGSEPAPPLKEIPDGEPGAGQYLLPLGNSSTSVDPDLINNINSLPYAQRFRLIFNELGASLAGRGEDLEEVIKRSNPILRDVDRLFGILAEQREQLAQLTADSDEILEPFARERASVAGFFTNAGAAAEASAEEGESVEASLRKLPTFLRELRQTMVALEGFSDAATPVFSSFGQASPAFTEFTRALTPFSAASTVSLKSLGVNGAVAGPRLRAADPVVRKATELAVSGAEPTSNLAEFLVSTNETGGFDGLVDLIYNSAATTNEFDQYGHFGRTLATLTNCTNYVGAPTSGCSANFNGPGAATASSAADALALYRQFQEEEGAESGGISSDLGPIEPLTAPPAPAEPAPAPEAPGIDEGEDLGDGAEATEEASSSSSPRQALLDYLLGP